MRQVILDTETTGLDYRSGDRVIEIGCVEMVGRKLTGRRFHRYINPQRDIDAGAQEVHGLTREFLADKPLFSAIADELEEFIAGTELIIHNASFDVGFLDHELGLLGRESIGKLCAGILDTLRMARELRPGKRNSLDALCSEYGVNNSGRHLHGALLDAELLAEVYLAMTRGQDSLIMDIDSSPTRILEFGVSGDHPAPKVIRATAAELADHARVMGEIGKESGGKCLWEAEKSA
ncbi:MAG: DNA polymerase III subunit epsilon [Proteobacteria bacterium]|nr:DNA polymerase III subunit epsilon [Pseudomonadota bacterium]HQR02516.1 DNA polymerase III subunit epsilon [Rhodocyclaceae bacterium]